MKKKTTIAAAVLVSAISMALIVPVNADPIELTDQQLDSVSSRNNSTLVNGVDTTNIVGLQNVGGNIQVGYYQWISEHVNDSSHGSDSNNQSGDNSMVQQNAAEMANELAWGGASQSVTNNFGASVTKNQILASWMILYLGGY